MAQRLLLYVGNYTRGTEAAIYRGAIDPVTGAVSPLGSTSCAEAPSYLALHPSGRTLYAVSETPEGSVHAFRIDPDSGDLTFLNRQPTGGSPCHAMVDATGGFLLTANYGGGSVVMHPIGTDGDLGEHSDFRQHTGASVNPQRQGEPHAHSINIDPTNRFAFCADLGLDEVIVYGLDVEAGKLRDHGAVAVAPGAGPRHFAVHPNRRTAYAINEIANTVTAFAWNAEAGQLSPFQEISTIPDGYTRTTHTADIHLTPDGRALYGSNRGHESIAVFAVDDEGRLEARGHQAVPSTPRSFVVDPSGTWLYSGGQNTDTVAVFHIGADGALTDTGQVFQTPSPVCLKILSIS